MVKKATESEPVGVVALTGGTGFLGTHVMESLINAGYHVKALTRRPQADRNSVTWIEGDINNNASLSRLCEDADVLIHCAGLVKALNRNIFFDVNVNGTKAVFQAAARQGIKRVLNISSLAAREPRLSHYGASKAAGELLLSARKWPFSWVTIRPPGIYGPGDLEILKLFKVTKLGFLPALGSQKNRFSMIHVVDLANAIVTMVRSQHNNDVVEIDDLHSGGYRIADVAKAITQESQKAPVIITLPFPVLGFLGIMNDLLSQITRTAVTLSLSKARYLCHSDWTVRSARRPLLDNWEPKFNLTSGLKDTMQWYQKNGLL